MSNQSNDADKSAPPTQPSEEGRSITVGNTVVKVVGAGVGKTRQTSGVWKYVIEFEPPVQTQNVKCLVKRKLPASGGLPARDVVCGHLMKYQRAEKGKKKWWDERDLEPFQEGPPGGVCCRDGFELAQP